MGDPSGIVVHQLPHGVAERLDGCHWAVPTVAPRQINAGRVEASSLSAVEDGEALDLFEEQSATLLLGQIESLTIFHGRQAGRLDPARIDLTWRNPEHRPMAPVEALGNPVGELVYDDSRWISHREAASLLKDSRVTGYPITRLRRALRNREIEQRPRHGNRPAVFKPSLLAFIER